MFSYFERIIAPFPSSDPVQAPSTLVAFCRHYTQGMGATLILMSMTTAVMAIFEVQLFGFLGQLVDWLISKDPQTLWRDERSTLIFWSVMLLLVMPLVVLLNRMLIHQALLGNFPMSIRWLAHRYLLQQSVSFYQNDFAGRIATKVMQTSLAVRETVTKLLDVMVYVLVYFSTMLFVVAQADSRMMLPVLIWLLLYIGVQLIFVPRLKAIATEQANARSDMTGRIVDSYTNINTVKLFSHSKRESDYARDGMQGFLTTVYGQMRLATGLSASVSALNYLLVFSTAALSIWLWSENSVSIGAIAIAVGLAMRLNGMSQWIMWEVSALFENIGTVLDGIKTLSQPQTVVDKPDAEVLDVVAGAIEFKGVGFHYGKDSGVIDSLNLNIKAGEKVGVVGRSGAGKSTLVNLLLRFYDLAEGKISIDGQDISAVQQESLRAHIGMVTQDTSLLHRSVRENILYGHPDASEQELIAAAEQAEALEFIAELTDPNGNQGFDAQVGERGVKLSGGQRQRIAIARVLLKDAPILILDEATSALDSEVEAAIQASLNRLMQKKTVIAIAHRLSTIAAMDRLIVIDEGKIVEQGTHQELVALGGIYAGLWAHQTGGFIGES
jgi:ATP-binding cassette subfamily B multidrug efflux pump